MGTAIATRSEYIADLSKRIGNNLRSTGATPNEYGKIINGYLEQEFEPRTLGRLMAACYDPTNNEHKNKEDSILSGVFSFLKKNLDPKKVIKKFMEFFKPHFDKLANDSNISSYSGIWGSSSDCYYGPVTDTIDRNKSLSETIEYLKILGFNLDNPDSQLEQVPTPLVYSLKQGSAEAVEVILQNITTPNQNSYQDFYSEDDTVTTPLIFAIKYLDPDPEKLQKIKLLLKYKANANEPDASYLPLTAALLYIDDDSQKLEVVKALMEHRASISKKDANGNSAITMAEDLEFNDPVRQLILR